MDDITSIIASNLQMIRKEKQLTLQDLADLTGVSKSMLGEIERGTSNPTINVLWKISTGLKVSISKIIHDHRPQCWLVKEQQRRNLHEDPTKISLIFECDHTRNFEVYYMEFQPGTVYESPSHEKGVVEYLMVHEGIFVIKVNDNVYEVNPGDSILFEADNPHSYSCGGPDPVKAYSLIYYSFT